MTSDLRAEIGLRAFVRRTGAMSALAFLVVGLAFDLQIYGDGSIFSYAVAARDVWAFHWHNIATRSAVYALTLWPGEAAVSLTGDGRIGVFVYGLCLFCAQAAGLFATYFLDRTANRLAFSFACASTALACPLVFGFPTEMWVTHALFWPAFASAWSTPRRSPRWLAQLVLTIALVLTHEGGLVLAFGIATSLALRSPRDTRFFRALACFGVAFGVWLAVNAAFPPDAYFGHVRVRAASEFFEAKIFESPLLALIGSALAGYFALLAAFSSFLPRRAHLAAGVLVIAALVAWWLLFDRALHADNRYYLRTILLLATCALAATCAFLVMRAEGAGAACVSPVRQLLDLMSSPTTARALSGAFALVLLVHVVETAKFLRGWTDYRAAVRALATGDAADPALGDPDFVSSARIPPDLNRLSWFSTTPYLAALLANFSPNRLVIDPAGNYFWLSCATATSDATKASAIPAQTREMVRAYSCLHRS